MLELNRSTKFVGENTAEKRKNDVRQGVDRVKEAVEDLSLTFAVLRSEVLDKLHGNHCRNIQNIVIGELMRLNGISYQRTKSGE